MMTHLISARIVQWTNPSLLLLSLSSARNPSRLAGSSLIQYAVDGSWAMLLGISHGIFSAGGFRYCEQLRLSSSKNRDGPNEHRSQSRENRAGQSTLDCSDGSPPS